MPIRGTGRGGGPRVGFGPSRAARGSCEAGSSPGQSPNPGAGFLAVLWGRSRGKRLDPRIGGGCYAEGRREGRPSQRGRVRNRWRGGGRRAPVLGGGKKVLPPSETPSHPTGKGRHPNRGFNRQSLPGPLGRSFRRGLCFGRVSKPGGGPGTRPPGKCINGTSSLQFFHRGARFY